MIENDPLAVRQERPPVGCGSRSVRSDVLLSEAADIMAEAEVHHLLAPWAMDFLGICWGSWCGCCGEVGSWCGCAKY